MDAITWDGLALRWVAAWSAEMLAARDHDENDVDLIYAVASLPSAATEHTARHRAVGIHLEALYTLGECRSAVADGLLDQDDLTRFMTAEAEARGALVSVLVIHDIATNPTAVPVEERHAA